MFHKVKDITVLSDYKILVQFCEGVIKQYDVKSLFNKFPAFKVLQDNPETFSDVTVDIGGYGIVWNDDVDLSCDELWDNGETVKTPFDGLMAFGDATTLWGLNESTLRKAITYGKLTVGTDVCKYGKQWVITVDAMYREYGQPKGNFNLRKRSETE